MNLPDFSKLPVVIKRGRLTVEIDDLIVKVTDKEPGLLDKFQVVKEWEAPISEFNGVLFRSESRHEIEFERSEWVTWHKLILFHQNKKKSLELYKSEVESDIRRLWAAAASALRLPALHKTGNGIESRTPTDLEKPLCQLAMEGKISVDFDAHTAPPKGIVLETKQGYQRVTCGNRFFKRCIEITPSGFRCYLRIPFGTFSYQDIQFTKLMSVERYDAIPAEFGFLYWVSGRGATINAVISPIRHASRILVGGLNNKQSRWLKNFILAAVIAESC